MKYACMLAVMVVVSCGVQDDEQEGAGATGGELVAQRCTGYATPALCGDDTLCRWQDEVALLTAPPSTQPAQCVPRVSELGDTGASPSSEPSAQGALTAQDEASLVADALPNPSQPATEAAEGSAKRAGWTWDSITGTFSASYRLYYNGDKRGTCVVDSANNTIKLGDNKSDSMGQRAYWWVVGSSTIHTCNNDGGSGSSKTCAVPNSRIGFQFCQKNSAQADVACVPVRYFN
ncbi:MAG: hypothetical protein IPJ65_31560 [Archangiaceae bacterium]|nr:hypothetical protein [Archangiaceae bacterium]